MMQTEKHKELISNIIKLVSSEDNIPEHEKGLVLLSIAMTYFDNENSEFGIQILEKFKNTLVSHQMINTTNQILKRDI